MSWREAAAQIGDLDPNERPQIPDYAKSVMTSVYTLSTDLDLQTCNLCNRPLLKKLMPAHTEECQSRRNSPPPTEKVKRKIEVDVEEESEPKKPKLNNNSKKPTKPSKPSKPAKQVKSKAAKPVKEKNPVVFNPDKNCGTILPNGAPCMRSLTCKQHSMGAKRAVAGRSAPYDVLLSNYHRQHQVKQAQQSVTAAQAAQIESDQQQDLQAQRNPEKEIHQVLEGVTHAQCAPLATHTLISTSDRVRQFRMRETLALAALPRRITLTGDILYGRSLGFRKNTPDEWSYVRAPALQQAIYISQIQQKRKIHQRQQQLQQQQQQQHQQQQQQQQQQQHQQTPTQPPTQPQPQQRVSSHEP